MPQLLLPEYTDEILITLEEADRQQAKPYVSCNRCLVATALIRRGYRAATVGGSTIFVLGQEYTFNGSDILKLIVWDDDNPTVTSRHAPFYNPCKGLKLIATLQST